MPDEMTCFACEQEPTQQCPRCGRPYCDEHGEDVCDACLEPASGLPSFTLYRGSLLVLLIGTAMAVWFILQPPGDTSESAVAPPAATATEAPAIIPTATAGPNTTPAPPDGTPGVTATTPAGTTTPAETPGTTATVPAEDTPATPGTTEYVVQAGDTLFGICSTISSLDPADCVDQTLALNNLSDASSIVVGETLIIPL